MTRPVLCRMLVALSLTFATEANSSPPPPPPPLLYVLAKVVVPTLSPTTIDSYAAALHDNVTVTINGREVATSKTAWLALEKGRLGKVARFVLGHVVGGDSSILVLDRIDDRSTLPRAPGLLFDARYQTRAIRYEVGRDNLIHAIRIVQADGVLVSP